MHQYAMVKKSRLHDPLNVLIQRSVEHGLYQFYKNMETFLIEMKMKIQQRHADGEQQDVESITMDQIWLYVWIFLLANAFSTFVFIGENMFYHRKIVATFLMVKLRMMGAFIMWQLKLIGAFLMEKWKSAAVFIQQKLKMIGPFCIAKLFKIRILARTCIRRAYRAYRAYQQR